VPYFLDTRQGTGEYEYAAYMQAKQPARTLPHSYGYILQRESLMEPIELVKTVAAAG